MNPCLHFHSWHEPSAALRSRDVWTSVLGCGVFAPRQPTSSTLVAPHIRSTVPGTGDRMGKQPRGGGGGGTASLLTGLPVADWTQSVKRRLAKLFALAGFGGFPVG